MCHTHSKTSEACTAPVYWFSASGRRRSSASWMFSLRFRVSLCRDTRNQSENVHGVSRYTCSDLKQKSGKVSTMLCGSPFKFVGLTFAFSLCLCPCSNEVDCCIFVQKMEWVFLAILSCKVEYSSVPIIFFTYFGLRLLQPPVCKWFLPIYRKCL